MTALSIQAPGRIILIAALLVSACAAAGCSGSSDDRRVEVRGAVSLDGQPVEKGSITFFPAGGLDGPVAGAEIINGQYRIDAEKGVWIGRNKIELYGVKRTGKKTADRFSHLPETDQLVELFPPQYNVESTLFREVEQGKVNELNFDLTTK